MEKENAAAMKDCVHGKASGLQVCLLFRHCQGDITKGEQISLPTYSAAHFQEKFRPFLNYLLITSITVQYRRKAQSLSLCQSV